jgi:hypothetical protein
VRLSTNWLRSPNHTNPVSLFCKSRSWIQLIKQCTQKNLFSVNCHHLLWCRALKIDMWSDHTMIRLALLGSFHHQFLTLKEQLCDKLYMMKEICATFSLYNKRQHFCQRLLWHKIKRKCDCDILVRKGLSTLWIKTPALLCFWPRTAKENGRSNSYVILRFTRNKFMKTQIQDDRSLKILRRFLDWWRLHF